MALASRDAEVRGRGPPSIPHRSPPGRRSMGVMLPVERRRAQCVELLGGGPASRAAGSSSKRSAQPVEQKRYSAPSCRRVAAAVSALTAMPQIGSMLTGLAVEWPSQQRDRLGGRRHGLEALAAERGGGILVEALGAAGRAEEVLDPLVPACGRRRVGADRHAADRIDSVESAGASLVGRGVGTWHERSGSGRRRSGPGSGPSRRSRWSTRSERWPARRPCGPACRRPGRWRSPALRRSGSGAGPATTRRRPPRGRRG